MPMTMPTINKDTYDALIANNEAPSFNSSDAPIDGTGQARNLSSNAMNHWADLVELDVPSYNLPLGEDVLEENALHGDAFKEDMESPRTAPDRDEDRSTTPESLQDYGYHLRPRGRTSDVGFCTWIDQDASGTYDPSQEHGHVRPSRHRRTFKIRQRHDGQAIPTDPMRLLWKRQKELAQLAYQRNGSTFVITLQLQTTAAKCLLTPLSDHWPTAASERDVCDSRGITRRRCTLADDIQRPNLTGHREARGCWPCYELEIRCPLITDDGLQEWPCDVCKADDVECELVLQPDRKRPCEGCKRRKTSCSYSHDQDHTQPCLQCQETGQQCIAGPARDSVRLRYSYDRNWKLHPPPKPAKTIAAAASCVRCQEAGANCSLGTPGNTRPCIACDMLNEKCLSEPSATFPLSKGAISSGPDHSLMTKYGSSKKRQRPQIRSPIDAGASKALKTSRPEQQSKPAYHQPKTRRIVTKLCHPISFNFEDRSGKETCDFCTEAKCSLLGRPREVEVIEEADGAPFVEVSGSHHGQEVHPTRLCIQCTVSRISRLACTIHNLRPLKDIDPSTLDFSTAFNRILSNTPATRDRWCSVCPSLAIYECFRDGQHSENGCGFLACETCAVVLMNQFDGDLQSLLANLTDEPTNLRPFGLRADAELLRAGGEMVKWMRRTFEWR